jgi:hypothetical protein
VPAVANVPIRSLNDKMAVRVEAVNGKTRVRLMQPDGDIIDEKVLLQRGQSLARGPRRHPARGQCQGR